jgi:hypothetical protein
MNRRSRQPAAVNEGQHTQVFLTHSVRRINEHSFDRSPVVCLPLVGFPFRLSPLDKDRVEATDRLRLFGVRHVYSEKDLGGSGQRRVLYQQSRGIHIHRSLRKRLCCQSGDSVSITAAEPSGDSFAPLTSVAFMNSSSVIRSLEGWATVGIEISSIAPARSNTAREFPGNRLVPFAVAGNLKTRVPASKFYPALRVYHCSS